MCERARYRNDLLMSITYPNCMNPLMMPKDYDFDSDLSFSERPISVPACRVKKQIIFRLLLKKNCGPYM